MLLAAIVLSCCSLVEVEDEVGHAHHIAYRSGAHGVKRVPMLRSPKATCYIRFMLMPSTRSNSHTPECRIATFTSARSWTNSSRCVS